MKRHVYSSVKAITVCTLFAAFIFSGCQIPEEAKELSINFPPSGTVVREPFFAASGSTGSGEDIEVWVEKDGEVICSGQNVTVSDGKWSADFNMLLNPYGDYQVCAREAQEDSSVTSEMETNFDSQVIVLTGTTIDVSALYRNRSSQEILILRGRQPQRYFYGDTFLLIVTPELEQQLGLSLPDGLPDDYYMVYDDLSFQVHGTDVTDITILEDTYSLANGLTIGDSYSDITDLFGTGYTLTEFQGCNRYFMAYLDLGVMFEVLYADDTIFEINVCQVEY